MGVPRQASAAAPGRLGCALTAEAQDAGQPTFEPRPAVFPQVEGGGLVSNIDGAGAGFSRRFGRGAPVSSLWHQVASADAT
jgi:hypothetical protein